MLTTDQIRTMLDAATAHAPAPWEISTDLPWEVRDADYEPVASLAHDSGASLAAATLLAIAGTVALTACDDAEVAKHNISKDADNFKVQRRVVFVNGITDKYVLSIEGLCSINADTEDRQVEVTCKTGENAYKTHFLGLSDNLTYFVEQLDASDVSTDHYKVTYKPSVILPDLENTTGK